MYRPSVQKITHPFLLSLSVLISCSVRSTDSLKFFPRNFSVSLTAFFLHIFRTPTGYHSFAFLTLTLWIATCAVFTVTRCELPAFRRGILTYDSPRYKNLRVPLTLKGCFQLLPTFLRVLLCSVTCWQPPKLILFPQKNVLENAGYCWLVYCYTRRSFSKKFCT